MSSSAWYAVKVKLYEPSSGLSVTVGVIRRPEKTRTASFALNIVDATSL